MVTRKSTTTIGVGIYLAAAVGMAGTAIYQYDALNRLESVEYDDGTRILYSYDGVGNRTELSVTRIVGADLVMSKTDDPDPVPVGAELTYRLGVINNGPDPASGVVVTDTLPDEVDLVSFSPSQGSCSEAGKDVVCNLGELAKNSSATVELVVDAITAAVITNTAQVTAVESDPSPGNSQADEQTTVEETGTCPASTLARKTPQGAALLSLLYDLRDDVLAHTPSGREQIGLYYRVGPEATRLLTAHPNLARRSHRLLLEIRPTLEALVAGKPATLSRANVGAIDALLGDMIRASGKGELQETLETVRARLRDGALLEDLSIGVRGSRRVLGFGPVRERPHHHPEIGK
jgi:uncharacterized repeat protein (TIGR01451 family)